MIKVKDGYAKLIGTTYTGAANQVLLSNGGNLEYTSNQKANTLVSRDNDSNIYAKWLIASVGVNTITVYNNTGILTLKGLNGLYLRGNSTNDNLSLVLESSYFKPFNTANRLIDLGTATARWKGIYGITGNFTDKVTASGFTKTGSSDYNVLLGGGGHKSLNDFILKVGDTMTGFLGARNKYLIKPVAEYTTGSGNYVNGAITITLPADIGNTMTSMWIDVYNYEIDKSFSVHVGGYTYNSPTGYAWTSAPFATVYGAVNYTIRLGHTDTNFIIYIGETNTVWRYPLVIVRDVILGHVPNYVNWCKNWNISFSTTFSTIDVTINHCVLTTKNYTGILDTRYYTKELTDDKYITLATNQRVSGLKTFLKPVIIETGENNKLVLNNTDGEKHSIIDFREANTSYGKITATASKFEFSLPITSSKFIGNLQGNADSATKLTSSAGSNIKPIYFKDGKPVACDYLFGNLNGNAATFTAFPDYNKLVELGYNTEANKNNREEYLKGLCKWLVATYPKGGNFIGKALPNSLGFCHIYLYDSSGSNPPNSEGMPKYCSGAFYPIEGGITTFETYNYSWHYRADYVTTTIAQNISGIKTFTTLLKFTVTDKSPFTVASDIKVEKLNADLLDGYHETSFYRSRDLYQDALIASTVPAMTELVTDNRISGSWRVSHNTNGASGHLVQFFSTSGSTAYMQFYSNWDSSLYWRNSTDYKLNTKPWKTIIDSSNYTSLIKKIGTTTVGSDTRPIYLNAGVPTLCDATLDVSISGNAKRVLSNPNNLSTPGGNFADVLKVYFENNKDTIPRNYVLSYKINAYTNTGLAIGYFHDTDNFGGFFIAHYNTPRYVGISGGNYIEHAFLTDKNYTTTLNPQYVQSLGVNGNSLTWTKNGTTTNITIPFAKTAEKVLTVALTDTYDSPADFLESYWDAQKTTLPKGALLSVYSTKGRLALGQFINNETAYGGFFVSHYNIPYYVGIAGGAFTNLQILTTYNYKEYVVTELGTSGNYLTWTKNGTVNNITVPYASNADTLDGIHASGLFTNLSNSDNKISITIGGTNKTLTVGYAMRSSRLTGSDTTNLNIPYTWDDDGVRIVYDVYSNSSSNKPAEINNANGLITIYKGKNGQSNLFVSQLAFPDADTFYFRKARNGTFSSWKQVAFTSDRLSNPYALTLKVNGSSVTYDGSSAKTFNVNLGNYVTLDGTQTISGAKTFSSQLKFTVALGTSPFTVTSTTKVSNLNADMLDGLDSTNFIRMLDFISSDAATIDANTVMNDCVTNAYKWSNTPSNTIASLLDLSYSSDWKTLLFMIHGGSSSIYVRSRYSGTTWGSWKRIAYTSDIPSIPSELPNPYSLALKVDGVTQTTYDGSSSLTFNVTLPTELANPYSLTLLVNGTTKATYDGSSSQTVNISVPTITDYYWANVKVSSTSSTSTSPTFWTATANNESDSAFKAKGGFYSLGMNDSAFSVNNSTGVYTTIAGAIDLSLTGNTNVISRYLVDRGTGSASIDAIKSSSDNAISGWSFKFNKSQKAFLSSGGNWMANGFHHNSVNSDNYVLLAGGGYKALSSLGSTVNNAGSGTQPVYTSNGTVVASTSDVGGSAQPIYMSKGKLTAFTGDVGSLTRPVYLNKGVINNCSYTLSASVSSGTTGMILGYVSSNLIGGYPNPVGNPNKGIYIVNGVPTAMTYSLQANVLPSPPNATAGALAYFSTATDISIMSDTVGNAAQPIYLNKGVPTACTGGNMVRYFASYEISGSSSSTSFTHGVRNYDFLRTIHRIDTGDYEITVLFPTGYSHSSAMIWGCGLFSAVAVAPYSSINSNPATYTLYNFDETGPTDRSFKLFFLCI